MASVVKTASKTASLGARLGLQASAAEMQASLRPQDYVYGQPTPQQLQRLLKQQMGAQLPSGVQTLAGGEAATSFGGAGALQGTAPAGVPKALAAAVDDLFNNHLDLDDDDCLRILLGEDEGTARSGAAAAPSTSGSGKGAGGSEKSSATAEQGEGEAASADDDDIAMLFGELRDGAAASLDPLELHLLGTAPLAASDDASETASQGDGAAHAAPSCTPAGDGASDDSLPASAEGSPKRAKTGATPPARPPLMLSMDYEKAAESINLELLATGRKVAPSEGSDAMLPLLSPLMDFAALDMDTPDSPSSLASDSEAVVPSLQRQDSTSKRKRAVVS